MSLPAWRAFFRSKAQNTVRGIWLCTVHKSVFGVLRPLRTLGQRLIG